MVGSIPVHAILTLCDENMGDPARCIQSEVVCVGSRVRCDDFIGTVRYIGEVGGYKGLWYGIDWDDSSRGKHNGSVNGVQYFSAVAETSGSFVRPNKLSTSMSCADAIRKYYGEKEDETTAALNKAVIEDWKRQIKVPFIEMIGFELVQEKQGSLDRLLDVCVGDMCIWTGGNLTSLCPSLQSLDLSRNLLSSWQIIADITSQLPSLNTLELSKNRLVLPSSDQDADDLSSCFRNLRKIILMGCDLDWQNVMRISRMIPRIRELILASNHITTISLCGFTPFLDVTTVILDGNPLMGFDQVLKLGYLEHLRLLSLNNCGLKSIVFDDEIASKTENFRNLEILLLKQNLINDWRSISELDKLQNLHKLYFLKNPIMDMDDYDTSCQFLVARIGNLKELNGSELTREMRRGAEYDYLKKYGGKWNLLPAEGPERTEFCLAQSRFPLLIAKYGLPEASLLQKKENTNLICTKLIEIILKDESSELSFKKKLPSTMTVQKLTALVRRLFASKNPILHNTTPSLYCLFTNKGDKHVMTIPLENQLKELDFYSVNNGDIVLVKW